MKKRKIPQLSNYFKNKQLDYNIYFESDILKEIIPKYIKINKIIFHQKPKFIKVNNIDLIIKNDFINQYNFYKQCSSNNYFIEPVFIQNPNILEMYYNSKNISYEYINNPIIDEKINKFMINEQYNLFKIKLKYLNDEIAIFNN